MPETSQHCIQAFTPRHLAFHSHGMHKGKQDHIQTLLLVNNCYFMNNTKLIYLYIMTILERETTKCR